MAQPSPSFDVIPVFGTYKTLAGTPISGKIKFTVNTRVTSITDKVIFPAGTVFEVPIGAETGQVYIELPAVDDPDNFPDNWSIQVEESFNNGRGLKYSIQPKLSMLPGGLDLRTVITGDVAADPPNTLYRGIPGGVAPLDADGDVTDADGNKVIGGGGGGGGVTPTELTSAINTLKGGAPGSLDTLGKLATAVGAKADATAVADALALKADDGAVVKLSGNQNVAGAKTFAAPPTVPTPTAAGHAVNKEYADALGGGTATPDADTTTNGKVRLAGDLAGTATAPQVAKVKGVAVAGVPVAGQVLTATGSAAAGWATPVTTGGGIFDLVQSFGGKDDAVYKRGGATANSAVITTTTPTFTSTAVDAGKAVSIDGAYTNSGNTSHFLGKILSVQSPTQCTLSAAPNVTVSNREIVFGTDNWQAIMDAQAALTAKGGTLLYSDRGTGLYLISQAIDMLENVEHRFASAKVGIVNRWSGGTNVHPLRKAAFCPGFVHGGAMWTAVNGTGNPNPGAPKLPHYPIAAVSQGSTTVTGTTAGQVGGNLAVGDYVAVRSAGAHTQAAGPTAFDEMPFQLYFARVTAETGDTVTLSHPSPYDIDAGGFICKIDGTATSNGTFFTGNAIWPAHSNAGREAMWMTSNVAIDFAGGSCDAKDPIWGGGVIGFTMRNLRSRAGFDSWDSFVTINSMCDAVIEDCDANFSYTFAEMKLGSGGVIFNRCSGRWVPGGGLYAPIGIGESAHSQTFIDCDLYLPRGYANSGAAMIDIRCSKDINFVRGNYRSDASSLDAMVGLYDNSEHALNYVDGVLFDDVRMVSYGSATAGSTGVNRGFRLAIGTAPNIPRNVTLRRVKMSGTIRPSVNEWVRAGAVRNLIIDDCEPPEGTIQVITNRTSGKFNIAHRPNQIGRGSISQTVNAMGWIGNTDTVAKQFGQLNDGAIVTRVIIEVVTAFAGATGSNTISVGHNAVANGYAVNVPVDTVGVRVIEIGTATIGGTLLGKRLGSSGTALRNLQAVYNGVGATAGSAHIIVEYISASANAT